MKKIKFGAILAAAITAFSLIPGVPGRAAAPSVRCQMTPTWEMKAFAVSSSPKAYTPAQMKKAYGVDSTVGTGKGKTIAIVVAYGSPSLKSDIAAFDKKFGLADADLTFHDCGVTATNRDWAIETSLDTEWAHVMAPDAKLLVVEAVSDSSADLLSAVDYASESGAQIVTMSWGDKEHAALAMEDRHFTGSGIVYLAAAGDDGAQAVWPASSPNVISVGGTTLKLDKNGDRLSESAWVNSGGGKSRIEAAPSWQTQMGIQSATRSAPDVAFDADSATGVSMYCGGKWYDAGGTSLGAPSWAGIVADLNQSTVYLRNAGSLYVLAGSDSYRDPGNCFNDITTGSNGLPAAVGYDEATGLGTPNCAELNRQTSAEASALSAVTDEKDSLMMTQQITLRYSHSRCSGRHGR